MKHRGYENVLIQSWQVRKHCNVKLKGLSHKIFANILMENQKVLFLALVGLSRQIFWRCFTCMICLKSQNRRLITHRLRFLLIADITANLMRLKKILWKVKLCFRSARRQKFPCFWFAPCLLYYFLFCYFLKICIFKDFWEETSFIGLVNAGHSHTGRRPSYLKGQGHEIWFG